MKRTKSKTHSNVLSIHHTVFLVIYGFSTLVAIVMLFIIWGTSGSSPGPGPGSGPDKDQDNKF